MKSRLFHIVFPALLIFCAAFALYAPSLSFSLVNYDDPVFITHNPIVFNGFSWTAIRSAFTELHGDECMYVPLLWVSYLLDLKFLGASQANPWGFHFTNVLLHALNSALLYLLLLAFCKKPWRAFFFAAIWAFHPLRVESVAWISSRKDVLSTLFALLCVGAYWRAWRPATGAGSAAPPRLRPSLPLYWTSLFFFLVGLLAKPMLVTIPFLLLLLDAWPLRRVELSVPAAARAAPRLLLEKLPFFLGAAVAATAVYSTQTGAMSHLPLWVRLYCLPSNYLYYLGKFFFPVHLFAMVPRTPVSRLDLLLAVAILAAGTAWTWRRHRTAPNEFIGWLAFLGLLFPVVGIVVIGIYPVSDRYSYLPAMGLSLALLFAWPSGRWPAMRRGYRPVRLALAVALLGALAILTARLLPNWKDDKSMYANVARQSPGHYGAIHYQAREEVFANGNFAVADRMADQLLAQKPCVSFGLVLKIICLSQLQSTAAALEFAQAHYPPCDNLGNPGVYEGYLTFLHYFAGHLDEAWHYMEETFHRSVFEPKSEEQLLALAMLLAHERGDEATALAYAARISSLKNKTRLAPEDYLLSYTTLWSSGLYVQTLPLFQRLVQSCAERPDLLNNVAWLLATTAGSPADPQDLLAMVRQALSGSPDHPVILDTLAVVQANAGDFEGAIQTAQRVAAFLEKSTAIDAPGMLRSVRKRIELYRAHQPYREFSSSRLLYAP